MQHTHIEEIPFFLLYYFLPITSWVLHVHGRRGLKRSSSPSGPSLAVPDGSAPIAAMSDGSFGCSRSYNTCTSSCKVLQYACRFSRDALSSATWARALASQSQAKEHESTAQSMAVSRSEISYYRRLTSADSSAIRWLSRSCALFLWCSSDRSCSTRASGSPIGSLLPLLLPSCLEASWCRGTPWGPVDFRWVVLVRAISP
jgi:hypothetical protein